MRTVTDSPIVTKEHEYKIGVNLSESVLTCDLSRHLAVILVSRDFRQSENAKLHANGDGRPIVAEVYEYKMGVKLSESALTFDLSCPLGAILVSRDFRQSEKCVLASKC